MLRLTEISKVSMGDSLEEQLSIGTREGRVSRGMDRNYRRLKETNLELLHRSKGCGGRSFDAALGYR